MDPDPLSCITLIDTVATAVNPLISIKTPELGGLVAVTFAVLLLFMSAFISGSEIAYFSITKDDCDSIDNDSVRERVIRLLSMPERLLATILISNNLVNVAIVILLNFFMSQLLEIESAVLDFIIQSVILTFLILLFGEIIPKLYASDNNVKFASFAAGGLSVLFHLLSPLSRLMVKSSTFLNKMVTKHSDDISMEDLSQALEISDVKSGDERELLQGILEFGGKTVAEIMRPRIDVIDIDYNSDFNEVVNIVVTNGYSRMPVYADTPDNIKGILYAKDLLPYIGKSDRNFNWQRLLRDAYYVPETRMIDDLLEDFRKKKIHMAIVVDEYGCTQGIATLEDVLEEIVGDIDDEYDTDEKSYTKLTDDTYIFDGKTLLNDFCKITGVDEEELEDVDEDADTIAGLLLNRKGDFLKEKEQMACGRCRFTVLSVLKHRIATVRVKILPRREDEK